MRIESAVEIREGGSRQTVPADLIIGVTVDEVDEAVALWIPFKVAQEQTTGKRSQHSHWDWSRKARAIQGAANYSIIGVRVGVEMQGLLLWDDLFEKARHRDQLGLDLVYVHFVSTAPWNDREIVDDPRFVGAGTLLVRTAVERSIDLGYKGRLGLHSLVQAEPFYRDRCRMADLGPDNSGSHKGLRYFEFTPTMANDFLIRTEGTQ